jgi:hypothetical protein
MKIAPPSRGALRAPREGKMILKLFVKIYKIPTQGRQDFKPLNLWDGSESIYVCKAPQAHGLIWSLLLISSDELCHTPFLTCQA